MPRSEISSPHGNFLELLWRERATAILRTDRDDADVVMESAVHGGFRIIEFTLTVPGVYGSIDRFARRGGLTVGAGTVLTVEEARRSVDSGAQFLVSPVTDLEVIEEALRLGVPMFPGAHTPSEMLVAHRAGATAVKVFPALAGGPATLKACLGPLGDLKLFPTHGVDGGNVADYLAAGAFAVGFVNSLFDPELVRNGDFEGLEARASSLRRTVESIERAELPPS